MKKTITEKEMNSIYLHIQNSIFDLQSAFVFKKEIAILMPDWLKGIMQRNPLVIYAGFSDKETIDARYAGIKVYPHYQDEVVVFFKDYHVNTNMFKPMIYQIKTEDEIITDNRNKQ